MVRKSTSIERVANEADLDLDQVLVTAWDLGIDVEGPTDIIGHSESKRLKRALGIATKNQIRAIAYWCELLGVDRGELEFLLAAEGYTLKAGRKVLPRGALRMLKALARDRGIDILTGVITPKELPQVHESSYIGDQHAPSPSRILAVIGHERDIRWLTQSEVEAIHYALVEDFAQSPDPIDPPGVRSEHLLASAVYCPQTSNAGQLKYPTPEMSAAALLHSIIQDHPFYNGNKRTALVSMLVVLDENGLFPLIDHNELFRLVLKVAQHRVSATSDPDDEVMTIAEWLCERTRLTGKGERTIPWRRLRRTLRNFGCWDEFPGGVGNRIDIYREIMSPRRPFKPPKTIRLHTQVAYGDEGRDVEIDAIKKIRADLRLDDDHAVDSIQFYEREGSEVQDFIATYRKTLQRLARL